MAASEDLEARSLLDQTDIIEVIYWVNKLFMYIFVCLLYTSDAADE